MKKLERIYHDGVAWNFSDYFDYVRGVAGSMPSELREFATDVSRYSLHGSGSLHDARIMSIVVKKNYKNNYSGGSTDIELTLIDQLFEGKIILEYLGVESFSLNEVGLSGNPHADIILHEVSVITSCTYRHQILLDHDGLITVEFSGFSCRQVKLDS